MYEFPRILRQKERSSTQKLREFPQSLGQRPKKKGFHLKICANFDEFRNETTKKKGLYCKICEKTVLAYEIWGDNQYFGSLWPQTALEWH